MRFLRQTLVIARRDFIGVVMTPTFLIFLLAPLLMVGVGGIAGFGASRFEQGRSGRMQIVALVGPGEAARLEAADRRLRPLFDPKEAPPHLVAHTPALHVAEQARALARTREIAAVLVGPLTRPAILHRADDADGADYLAVLASAASSPASPKLVSIARHSSGEVVGGDGEEAFATIFVMFFLTLLLSGQAVGMLAEERGNKVVEILAAAVPLEAVFFGKLVGMFGIALLFVGFWGGVLGGAAAFLPDQMAGLAAFAPAVGLPLFLLLVSIYFTLAFLLFGALFLGVGAQAGSMREIQMLSLPITLFQVGMFALASAAAGAPDSTLGTIAALFPFSSPFAMAARAASEPGLWPHPLAILWQLLWLTAAVTVAARLFRRGVLKSGGVRRR